jgi:hypothetical protein
MTMRVLASYGAIAAATLVAALALTACEPPSLSVATPDYGAALDWSQPTPSAEPKT